MAHATADARFDRLAGAIFESLLELRPTYATLLGIAGPWDDRLPERSEEGARRELGVLHAWLHELGPFRERDLSIDRAVDLRLARGGLNARILRLQRMQPWKHSPSCYVEDVIEGIQGLLFSDSLTRSRRHECLLARLRAAVQHLEDARLNLENPPPSCTEGAEICARGAALFWEQNLVEHLRGVEEPGMRAELLGAARRSRMALESFANWLQGILMSRSNGTFEVGRASYERLLAEEQAVTMPADDLIALGQKAYQETVRELKRASARIDPQRPWSRVMESLKTRHPEPDRLLGIYRSEIARARAFLDREKIVPLPGKGDPCVEAMPGYARTLSSRTMYIPASAKGTAPGVLWINVPASTLDEAHRVAVLRGHPIDGVTVQAMRDVWPGHHLRSLLQNAEHPGSLRRMFPARSFEQGWALYAPEMMEQAGFYRNDRTRMIRLHDRLIQTCRVVVDVELHTGRLGWMEAIEFLVRKAHMERAAATVEVRRACADPTAAVCDIIGHTQIVELLAEVREAEGDAFNIGRFHRELLRHGPIPLELIRMEMGLPAGVMAPHPAVARLPVADAP